MYEPVRLGPRSAGSTVPLAAIRVALSTERLSRLGSADNVLLRQDTIDRLGRLAPELLEAILAGLPLLELRAQGPRVPSLRGPAPRVVIVVLAICRHARALQTRPAPRGAARVPFYIGVPLTHLPRPLLGIAMLQTAPHSAAAARIIRKILAPHAPCPVRACAPIDPPNR